MTKQLIEALELARQHLVMLTGGDTSQVPQADQDKIDAALKAAKEECCIPDEGEPFFVLLGRDPQAPGLVFHWANVRETAEPYSIKIEKAREVARQMVYYKHKNPDKGMSWVNYSLAQEKVKL